MPLALVASFELLDVLRLVGIAERLYRPVNTVAESKSGEFSDVAPFVSGKRGREVFLNGDVDFGVSNLIDSIVWGCLSL